jgi:hypothetical protein
MINCLIYSLVISTCVLLKCSFSKAVPRWRMARDLWSDLSASVSEPVSTHSLALAATTSFSRQDSSNY